MEKENKQTDNFLAKVAGFKSILILVVVVFILLVAYKYISSNIQEDKEMAIIRERSIMQQQQEDKEAKADGEKKQAEQQIAQQLDNCLVQAEQKKNKIIVSYAKINDDCKMDYPYAKAECTQQTLDAIEKVKAEEQIDKNNCYKRYK